MGDRIFLKEAVKKSKESIVAGGFPVGVVLVRGEEIIASGLSNGKQLSDPTNHAEITAIRTACKELCTRNLNNVILYSSLEPCLMCYSASVWASIPRIVYACGRAHVSRQHFEGDHDLKTINGKSRKPIEIVHFSELEEGARQVIEDGKKKSQKSFLLLRRNRFDLKRFQHRVEIILFQNFFLNQRIRDCFERCFVRL